MGKLEIPLPELGDSKTSLKSSAKALEDKIRQQTPENLRSSIVVRPFKKGSSTGLSIEYDDRAENFVYIAMEYPRGSGREETVSPRR